MCFHSSPAFVVTDIMICVALETFVGGRVELVSGSSEVVRHVVAVALFGIAQPSPLAVGECNTFFGKYPLPKP